MHGLKAKTLKSMLKKAGLKTSGKKATLRARAKSAHLMRGGLQPSFGTMEEPSPAAGVGSLTGGRRHGLKTKTLKRMLKKAGLKVSGKKSTLTKRAKAAHLMRGGVQTSSGSAEEQQTIGNALQWGVASGSV